MRKLVLPLLALTFSIIPAAPAAASDSLHVKRSVFTAEKNKQRHPGFLVQTVEITQDVPEPRVCITYQNTSKKSQGWGEVDILVQRMDGTEETLRLVNQVRSNEFVKCTKQDELADLVVGDMLVFDYTFENMLRLRRTDKVIDRFTVNSVVVAAGFPLYHWEVGVEPGEEEEGKAGGWLHAGNFNAQPQKHKQKHPATASKLVVMQQDVAAPNACLLYRNTFNKRSKGTVVTKVSFRRGEEILDSFTLTNRVKQNKARECRVGPDLSAGDIVDFDFEFTGMPRMAKNKTKTDHFQVNGVVASNGTPEFVSGSSSPSDPTDPTPGPTPAPSPSGDISSADIAAGGKLLISNQPVQLWRSKSSWGRGKWWVIGPKTRIDTSQLGNVVPSTVGFGNTIAAAVADYERKMGKLSGSGALSGADVKMLNWYSGINSDGGPTSLRKDRSKGFHGEYYRPGRGALHEGPFGSPAKALEWLRGQGL